MSLGEIEASFDQNQFIKCHRSYIVGIKYISSISKAELTLDDSKIIPVSRRLYQTVNQAFISFHTGGKLQKLLLARALYKNAPIIILDEPTAALDPIAEFEIYSKFNEFVNTKTAIYISHRLSSCRFCDDIAVFNEGHLIQRGTHDKLLADTSGKYYELWNAQAQYYA